MNKLSLIAILLGVTVSASAGTIASQTAGGALYNGVGYGQSVTTPTGGPWDHINFNFISGIDGSAYASGGLYVLTQTYTGTPGGLSTSTAGYLGFTNTINSGIWNFSGVTLNPATQYFFFMDGIVPLGQGILLTASGDAYPGGVGYGAGGAPRTYSSVAGADILFVLSGTEVSTAPEPGTWALMAGAGGFLVLVRRRRKAN